MKRIIYLLLCVIATSVTFGASAQDKIDKVLNDLEKKRDVTTTYSERRTKSKRKLYRTTRVLTFSNQEYYKRLEKAFEEERTNAVSAVKNNGTRTYRFEDKKTASTYSLTGSNGNYTVSMSWYDTSINEKDYNSDNNIFICDPATSDGTIIVAYDNQGSQGWADELSQWACEQREWAERSREQAAWAREQAAKAREQAAKAREQAAKARKEAAKLREQAAKERGKAQKRDI